MGAKKVFKNFYTQTTSNFIEFLEWFDGITEEFLNIIRCGHEFLYYINTLSGAHPQHYFKH
jgi:hypothetical protein